MALVWLVLFLVAAVPAAAAPVRLAPASGEGGARATLNAEDLPPGSLVELRVGDGPVKLLRADEEGRLQTRQRMPRRAQRRVRVALQDEHGKRVILHYRVRSPWSDFRTASAADWRGRVLRVRADLRRGKLAAVARVSGLEPGHALAAGYAGRRVGRARAGERGGVRLRLLLPQSAPGRSLELKGAGVRLVVALPTPPAVVAATADIACQAPYETSERRCRHAETAALVDRLGPDAVAIAGDVQYRSGRMSEFRRSFHRSWGRLQIPLRPVPGNHEYRTPDDADFFDYFAFQSGWRPPPWYDYDLGPWRLIALNSNCEPERVDCYEGSLQEEWLRTTLAVEPHRCTLAYWHHPRYSSGFHGSDPRSEPFWRALQDARAELVISGHDHHYERFAPQDELGQRDDTGIRQFVAGTGGSAPSVLHDVRAPHSEWGQNRHFGVLLLRLYERAYSWRFVNLGGRVLDRGNGSCI